LPSGDWPPKKLVNDIHTHDILKLEFFAGLQSFRKSSCVLDPLFQDNWELVCEWSEDARYQLHSQQDAEELLQAVADLNSGVVPWIKSHW
jgi:hypothetical protein